MLFLNYQLEITTYQCSDCFDSPQVMQVQDSQRGPGFVYDYQRSYLFLFHDVERGESKFFGQDSARIARHALFRGQLEDIFAAGSAAMFFELPAQVAVTNDAQQP